LHRRGIGIDAAAVSYALVVDHGEGWRLITSAFSHLDVWHLGMNVAGLWSLGGELEPAAGSGAAFLAQAAALVFLTGSAALAITHVLVFRCAQPFALARFF
jgi:membrane associated rhomboid family serine protease